MEQSKGYGGSKVTTGSIVSEDIDLFSMLDPDPIVKSGRTVTIRPLSENVQGPFQFHLEPQGSEHYLQLKSIRLTGLAQIRTMEDGVVPLSVNLSGVNLFPASLFKAIEVYVNDTLITDLSSALSPYQNYIQTILSYNESAQKTHLRGQMFIMDEAFKFDNLKISSDNLVDDDEMSSVNQGFKKRSTFFRGSKPVDFYIPLSSDFLQSDRLLHPSASVKIRLLRNTDEFSILSDSDQSFRVKMSNLRMHAHYVELHDAIVKKHNTMLLREPVVYPITRTVMREYNLASGITSKYISQLFTGKLPKSIVIGMVSARSFHGDQKLNPFNFQHYNVQEYSLKVNGEYIPGDSFKPDFDHDLYIREYMELYRNIGIDVSEDHGNVVTPELFANGCFFMAYDLTGHRCNMLHKHTTIEGNVDLPLVFKKALPEEVIVIVYATFDAHVEVFHDRGVKVIFD
ncbi:uncharacterized protein F54H12.2-like [Tigriopus californicus]|nr:uncharacterized protein F54H12.2-like [Tigriopus californicus]